MKVTSTIQYDEPTRRLWEELQKPYGSQSSFLRHLLLLEKYFRNGDLLLAQNANSNAIVYAESVQHRLQAYDNISPRPISVTQLSGQNSVTTANKAITISKVNPSTAPKPVVPAVTVTQNPKQNATDTSNSLLKTNATQALRSRSNYTVTTEPINGGDKANVVSNKTDLIKLNNATIQQTNTSTPKNKAIGLPPELICINSSMSGEKSNDKSTGPPSYQLQMQLTLQQQIQQQHQNSLLLSQQAKQLITNMVPPAVQPSATNQITSPKKQSSTSTATNASSGSASSNLTKSPTNNPNSVSGNKANIIRLPDKLTEVERRDSKNWRPTLMPINVEKNTANTEVYLTADGRRLPYLVQVQSGGKPYMISIHDYNRMCILRRERLLRDQTELIKNKSNTGPATGAMANTQKSVTPAPALTNTTSTANQRTVNVIDVDRLTQKSQNSHNASNVPISKVQIPNKVLEQNSLIPLNNKPNENLTSSDSLLKRNKNQSSTSLLKSNANHGLTATKSSMPQVQQNPHKLPLSLTNALTQSNVVSITSTPSISAILAMNSSTPASTPPPIQLIPNTQPITITNVSSGPSSSAANQANVSALEALFKTTNQVTTTPSTMWQWAEQLNKSNSSNVIGITSVDNSATSILSKIPKSLTVIPQQKRLSKGGDD